MMKISLSTIVKADKPPKVFGFNDIIAGIGSCFAQYVMERFEHSGFSCVYNPNGIIYNSHSIAKSLEYLEKDYHEESFFEYNGLWHSWEHHGSFSSERKEVLLERINSAKREFAEKLKKAALFILTPSSSVVYALKSSGEITANCHKFPNNNFSVGILSKEQNLENLTKAIGSIRALNRECLIAITLSPVRHYPGDLCLNSHSKANLLSAIREFVDKSYKTIYFPSYEILLDELRDYRFYADDMMHPGNLAREIIFKRFLDTFFDSAAIERIAASEKEQRRLSHINMKGNLS